MQISLPDDSGRIRRRVWGFTELARTRMHASHDSRHPPSRSYERMFIVRAPARSAYLAFRSNALPGCRPVGPSARFNPRRCATWGALSQCVGAATS